ncbi:hypothetical protein ACFL6H_02595 [Candidatus Latescibacterota bacterium]
MIKDQIEELIEESYLLSLSETEIRNYLRNFLESCETVMSQHIAIHEDMKVIGVKVSLLKAKLLLREWSHNGVKLPAANLDNDIDSAKSNIKPLVKQVMDIKMLFFNLFDRVNPKLKEAVIEEARNRKHYNTMPKKQLNIFVRKNLIFAGYIILLMITMFILVVFIYS